MKIKSKLTLVTALLFVLIFTLVIISTFFINKLASESGKFIQENYTNLGYIRNMQNALNNINSIKRINPDQSEFEKYRQKFVKNLALQQKNITEKGEKELIDELTLSYHNYSEILDIQNPDKAELELKYRTVNEKLNNLLNVNLNEIDLKNKKADKTARQAILYMEIIGGIAFILSFWLVFNFPGYIANPLIEIKDKIKEIANKNYDHRLIYKSKDELGELADAFNSMAIKLTEYEKSNVKDVQLEKIRIESIVKNLDEGIILLDNELVIKVINPAAADLLKLDTNETLGKYAPDLAVKHDLLRNLIQGITDESFTEEKIVRISIQNEDNYFKRSVFKVEDKNKENGERQTSGYIISIRNITEFKKLDLAKTNFIAIVSHELSTPIESLNQCIKLLEDQKTGNLNEKQNKLIESLKVEIFRLSRITEELLDISQVESGNIGLQISNVNPEDIIKYSLEALNPLIAEKNIQIHSIISEKLPKVKADLEKTTWVMTNLLSNAIRYTSDKTIRIELHHSFKELQFTVEDTGPGIKPADREKIFNRFAQLDDQKQREGIGLGLAISREFIEKQGGKIWVESEIGIGSKFIFTLPIA